jgi:hypothetical protein
MREDGRKTKASEKMQLKKISVEKKPCQSISIVKAKSRVAKLSIHSFGKEIKHSIFYYYYYFFFFFWESSTQDTEKILE